MNNAERKAIPIAVRLEAHSIPEPNCGCKLWTGAIGSSGHGRMKVGGKWDGAHRVAWREKNGPIPPGMFVCHKCDVRPCIEEGHLFLGTHQDNMDDMNAKGRGRPQGNAPAPRRGEENRSAKLTNEQVREIIDRPEISARRFAHLFGVAHCTVDRIRSGQRWAHLRGAS